MSTSESLVQLALSHLACTQKELALRVGVSPTQITKWKSGEHMSSDMEGKLRKLAGIDDADPEVVVWTGSVENAQKWDSLIRYLAEQAAQDAETGYDTPQLTEDADRLTWGTFFTLQQMGVNIPQFPEHLAINAKGAPQCVEADDSDDQWDAFWDAVDEHPVVALIYAIFKSLTNVYGFYAAYVSPVTSHPGFENENDVDGEIYCCLLDLAAAKLEKPPAIAPNFPDFRFKTLKSYKKWLVSVKQQAFTAGIPLGAELLNMVNHDARSLGMEAEEESLGSKSWRVHPDVYMNELLVGMRLIHQVLPVIMKKLGIDEMEFQVDESELRA